MDGRWNKCITHETTGDIDLQSSYYIGFCQLPQQKCRAVFKVFASYPIILIFFSIYAVTSDRLLIIPNRMEKHRIFTTSFASVYPHYIAKAEKKGRTKAEVDTIICWLTGYTQKGLQEVIDKKTDFETFFGKAPRLNENVSKITGVICGYRVEEIEDKLMQKIRYLDKLVDELAKGKAMEKILRK